METVTPSYMSYQWSGWGSCQFWKQIIFFLRPQKLPLKCLNVCMQFYTVRPLATFFYLGWLNKPFYFFH